MATDVRPVTEVLCDSHMDVATVQSIVSGLHIEPEAFMTTTLVGLWRRRN